MLDWPGKISAVLFLSGCNFRCPYCHNPDLAEGKAAEELDWGEVRDYLLSRRGWIDGVAITGGEPTIHSWLADLCAEIKEIGFGVKVDTNGSRPRDVERLMREGLVDYVAMDVKTSPARYFQAAGRPVEWERIEKTVNLLLGWEGGCEFRCTVVPGIVAYEDLLEIAGLLRGGKRLVLQQFKPGNNLDPSYADKEAYPDDLLTQWAESLSRFLPTTVRGLSVVGG
jgi:pyruvate formate lyase activating enzyme